MVYYKSYRIVDGKPRWVIVDNCDNIVDRSPKKEQIKLITVKKRIVMKNRICCVCGSSETYIDPSGKERWYNHICDKENCTKSLCHIHGNENYRRSVGISNRLSKYSEMGEGIIIEFVVMKIRKIKNANVEYDSFKAKFDLLEDPEYGNIQIKGPSKNGRRWDCIFGAERVFDTLFVLCMGRDRKNVERIYIVPESELYGESIIQIYEDFNELSKISKYKWVEKFKISKDIIDIYNNTYQDLMLYLKDKEFFGIEDLNNWLKGGCGY